MRFCRKGSADLGVPGARSVSARASVTESGQRQKPGLQGVEHTPPRSGFDSRFDSGRSGREREHGEEPDRVSEPGRGRRHDSGPPTHPDILSGRTTSTDNLPPDLLCGSSLPSRFHPARHSPERGTLSGANVTDVGCVGCVGCESERWIVRRALDGWARKHCERARGGCRVSLRLRLCELWERWPFVGWRGMCGQGEEMVTCWVERHVCRGVSKSASTPRALSPGFRLEDRRRAEGNALQAEGKRDRETTEPHGREDSEHRHRHQHHHQHRHQ
jgi:hypothetical protein